MTKFIIIFLAILLFSKDKEVPLGDYTSPGGYTICRLILNQDKTFEQENISCTWRYFAKGKWSLISDTIILTAEKVYSIKSNRRRTIVTDTNNLEYNYFKKFRYYLVISPDTLLQLYKYTNGKYYSTLKLARKIAKGKRQ